jgi:hypothetical protein
MVVLHTSRVPVAVFAGLAFVFAGCGSSGSESTASSAPKATAPALPPSGQYVSKMNAKRLAAAGVDTANVGGGGVWHLSVAASKVTITPPKPADPTTYPVVALAKHRLTVGGNKDCSVFEGQSQKSVYTISTSTQGLKFAAVKIACKEDGGSITAGLWTRP